jgi:hypothetical protein
MDSEKAKIKLKEFLNYSLVIIHYSILPLPFSAEKEGTSGRN